MSVAAWLVLAYLIGAIPTSYIAGKLGRGLDLRQHGSRNLGATNVYRVLGWKYAVPVALIDVAKGAVPVALFGRWPGAPAWLPVALGVTAVLGHVFSPFVGFKGGKGVATAGGVFVALAPLAILCSAAIWGVVLWVTGFVSVILLLAIVSLHVWVPITDSDPSYTFWAGVGLASLIVFSHRANIRRLLAGTEHKFRNRKGVVA